MPGAAFHRGESKQDYETPRCLLDPIEDRWGKMDWDLAASATNAKAPRFYTEADNSLSQDWSELAGRLWLNPPFDKITPWAAKCLATSMLNRDLLIFFLVPAAVGSNWFRDYVFESAKVQLLNGRVPFDPIHPKWGYPKDCMLCVYGQKPGFDVWPWRA